ncbi:MAG: Usg family protein [Bdellovibrionales bacterium]
MADLTKQLSDYRLTTAQVYYRLPDFEEILQEFIWQDYDLAPKFPQLKKFLGFWERKIDGKLHSVYVAKREIITTSDYRNAEWLGTVQ